MEELEMGDGSHGGFNLSRPCAFTRVGLLGEEAERERAKQQ